MCFSFLKIFLGCDNTMGGWLGGETPSVTGAKEDMREAPELGNTVAPVKPPECFTGGVGF